MNISEIYQQYKIMPQLQLHMLRVAGVASIIADNFEDGVENDSIVTACLLHDMGNIIKANLTLFLKGGNKEIKYWEKVKKDFTDRYGNKDHIATHKICEELGIDQNTIKLIDGFGFVKTPEIHDSQNVARKICVYSDMRVSPSSVVSLVNRLTEAEKRYSTKQKGIYEKGIFEKYIPLWKDIENQIFTHCTIRPGDITEEKVKLLIIKLRNYQIDIQ